MNVILLVLYVFLIVASYKEIMIALKKAKL